MGKMTIGEIKSLGVIEGNIVMCLEVDRAYWDQGASYIHVSIPKKEEVLPYQVGTLVKFSETNPEELVAIPTEDFDFAEFCALEKKIPEMTCEQMIATHHHMIGKIDASGICKEDFGQYYMWRVLNHNLGYCTEGESTAEFSKFFNSKYTSDYMKQLVKDRVKEPSEIVLGAIDSERNFIEFTEEEYDEIYQALEQSHREKGEMDISNLILSIAFQLNSEGAIRFLNHKVNPVTIIQKIVSTSGLSISPDYYATRGATLTDLNGEMLYAIYKKIERLDRNKAMSMATMTLTMSTLGATEFLESLYGLAWNDYDIDAFYSSFRGDNHEKRIINFESLAATSQIKERFKHLLPPEVVREVCGHYHSKKY